VTEAVRPIPVPADDPFWIAAGYLTRAWNPVKFLIPPENVHSPIFEGLTAQWPSAKLPAPDDEDDITVQRRVGSSRPEVDDPRVGFDRAEVQRT